MFHQLKISNIKQETSDCVSISFDIPKELKETFHFEAGQYLTLCATIKGEEVRRSYSLCSAPYESTLRVGIKQIEGGLFSTFANRELKVGDQLLSMAPTGGFKFDKSAKNIVCFAAGSGITPILSIIKTALNYDSEISITLVYGNRTTKDIIFHEEIEGLKNTFLNRFDVHYVLSREDIGTPLYHGYIDEEKAKIFSKYTFSLEKIDAFYMCGPHGMIQSVSNFLKDSGVDKQKIHFELFGTPAPKKDKKEPSKTSKKQADLSKVACTLDGKTVTIEMLDDGNHLLDAALGYGLDLPFACKGGVCSTCKCQVLEGEMTMDVNYALEEDEVKAGYILSCQARPVSETVKVNFDV